MIIDLINRLILYYRIKRIEDIVESDIKQTIISDGDWTIQLFRTIGKHQTTRKIKETNVQKEWIHAIQQSEKLIYIESLYFKSFYGNKSYEGPENQIVQAIIDHVNLHPNVKVVIIIPLHILGPHWKVITPVMVETFQTMVLISIYFHIFINTIVLS